MKTLHFVLVETARLYRIRQDAMTPGLFPYATLLGTCEVCRCPLFNFNIEAPLVCGYCENWVRGIIAARIPAALGMYEREVRK